MKKQNFFKIAITITTLGLSLSAAAGFRSNLPRPLMAQVEKDLAFLQTVEGRTATSYYKKIFGAGQLSGVGLMSFFASRIDTFETSDCGGPPAAACVNTRRGPHTMFIAPTYSSPKAPQLFRLAVMLHESRHTEGYNHVNCPIPFLDEKGRDIVGIITGMKLEGGPACDVTAVGAYAVGAVFLKNVELNCSNCTEKVKMDGKIFGNDTLKRIISPSERRLLVQDLGG